MKKKKKVVRGAAGGRQEGTVVLADKKLVFEILRSCMMTVPIFNNSTPSSSVSFSFSTGFNDCRTSDYRL